MNNLCGIFFFKNLIKKNHLGSPIVIVPKRNGTNEICICTESREPNKAIERERRIILTADVIIVRLNGAQVISKLDLKKGYHQIPIAEKCRYITAFCTQSFNTNGLISASTRLRRFFKKQSNRSSVASREYFTLAMISW